MSTAIRSCQKCGGAILTGITGWGGSICQCNRVRDEIITPDREELDRLRAEIAILKEEGHRVIKEHARVCAKLADLAQQLATITDECKAWEGIARVQKEQIAAANERVSSWWAALMEAAGCLEQAAMSMRDEDAKRAALGAAEHARNDAHRLAAISDLPEADKEKS